jgi:hypothetical protein
LALCRRLNGWEDVSETSVDLSETLHSLTHFLQLSGKFVFKIMLIHSAALFIAPHAARKSSEEFCSDSMSEKVLVYSYL